jgi:hypothetical protein
LEFLLAEVCQGDPDCEDAYNKYWRDVASTLFGPENQVSMSQGSPVKLERGLNFAPVLPYNGIAHFKKCKQLFEYKHLLLRRDIWWSKF